MTRTSSAVAPLLLAATTTLAEPVVFRNGDGAWFEWLASTPDVCSAQLGQWLDVTLPPSQDGTRTAKAVLTVNTCFFAGCEPQTLEFLGYGPPWIATDPVGWETDCCSFGHEIHIPVIDYAMPVGPEHRWETDVLRRYECEFDYFFVRTSFLGVRFADDASDFQFAWILMERRRPPTPDEQPETTYPTAWAFESDPNTPIPTPPCRADLDFNFQVDFFDYLQFVQDFDAGHWIANFEYDDQLDFFDYLAFLDEYSACAQ